MRLISPSFRDGAPIPRQHTTEGDELSPPLSWSDLPFGTRELVLVLEDADVPSPAGPATPFLLWLVYNLQPSLPGLELGANRGGLPPGAQTARNDLGRGAYALPVPRRGQHRYVFRLMALDTTLDARALAGAGRAEVFAALAGRVLDTAELTGTYQRGGEP
jgi:Raf kinase inhibitor-like YbhB/YbcL family protein